MQRKSLILLIVVMACMAFAILAAASASRVLIAGDNLIFRDGSGNEFKLQAGSNIVSNSITISDGFDFNDSPITDVGYIDLNTSNGIEQAEGRLVWNDDDGTMNIGLKGGVVNLQTGQEMVMRGKNTYGSSIGNGVTVTLSGGSGAFPTWGIANAADPSSSHAIGLATEVIANNQFGYITAFGLVRELDTSSFAAGDDLYLAGNLGGLVNAAPTNSNRKMHLGHVIRSSATEGIISVHPDQHPFFSELSGPVIYNGSIPFVSFANLTEDNGNLFWDDTNNRLGIGTNTPDNGYINNSIEASVFVLNSPRWDDMRMPATTARPGASSPGFEVGAVSNAVGAYCFDKTTDQELYFITQLPHDYDEGTDVELHLHWYPVDTGLGNVSWISEVEWNNISGTMGSSVFYNAVPDAADGTQYKHQYHDMMWLDGSGKSVSSILSVHLYRDANESSSVAGSDNYDDDACLLEADFHYQADTPGGSETENAK